MSQQKPIHFQITNPKEYFIEKIKEYFKTLGELSFKFYTLAGVEGTFITVCRCPEDSVSGEVLVEGCGQVKNETIGGAFEALKGAMFEVSSDAREWGVADDTVGEMQINFLNQLVETLNKWSSYSPYYLLVDFYNEDETVIFDYKILEGRNDSPLLLEGETILFGGFMPFLAVEDI